MAASVSSCLSNGGESERRNVWGEGKLTMEEETRCNELESSAALGCVVDAKRAVGERLERWAQERGANTSLASTIPSDTVQTRKTWLQGEFTMDEGKEERLRNQLGGSAAQGVVRAGADTLPDACLPAMTAKPADDWEPASDSLLPTGKLNGWANTQEDEDWLEDFDKTPSSEIGSHKTCSTQWSEMESQFSGVESQLSGNSYAGEEGNVMSGECCLFFAYLRCLVVPFDLWFLPFSFSFTRLVLSGKGLYFLPSTGTSNDNKSVQVAKKPCRGDGRCVLLSGGTKAVSCRPKCHVRTLRLAVMAAEQCLNSGLISLLGDLAVHIVSILCSVRACNSDA